MKTFSTNLYNLLLKPRHKDEDSSRRELILNILLLGTLSLAAIACLNATIRLLLLGEKYQGVPPLMLFVLVLIFFVLFLLSRFRFSRFAAYLFIFLYYLPATYVLFRWGILVPQGVLIYAMMIVMAGVLLGTQAAFSLTMLLILSLLGLVEGQSHGYIHPNLAWAMEPGVLNDAIVFSTTLAIILLVSWLSNRELEKSLSRARKSEMELKLEKDSLEIRVRERTEELRKIQLEKMSQNYRFAEVGKMALGILHDLANPLTSVSLSLEQLGNHADSEKLINRAKEGTKKIEVFLTGLQQKVRNQQEMRAFSAVDEILANLPLLEQKKEERAVEVIFEHHGDVILYGTPMRFGQLVINLVSNAIDAYENTTSEQGRRVLVTLVSQPDQAVLTVHDKGRGIAESDLKKVFDLFYTTKVPGQGTGVGLYMCKEIVEEDFAGTIRAESNRQKGTTLTVELSVS